MEGNSVVPRHLHPQYGLNTECFSKLIMVSTLFLTRTIKDSSHLISDTWPSYYFLYRQWKKIGTFWPWFTWSVLNMYFRKKRTDSENYLAFLLNMKGVLNSAVGDIIKLWILMARWIPLITFFQCFDRTTQAYWWDENNSCHHLSTWKCCLTTSCCVRLFWSLLLYTINPGSNTLCNWFQRKNKPKNKKKNPKNY